MEEQETEPFAGNIEKENLEWTRKQEGRMKKTGFKRVAAGLTLPKTPGEQGKTAAGKEFLDEKKRLQRGMSLLDRELKLQFVEALNRMEGKEHLAAFIAFGAAPTLMGKKPSSLIAFNSKAKGHVFLWRRYGREICEEFQLQYLVLKEGDGNMLVLFYKSAMLELFVNNERNLQFLRRMGYGEAVNLEQKLHMLKKRFKELCPHEVGIFLGIPVEDVEGFIKHKGKKCLASRDWKVYRNPGRAEILFKVYDAARTCVARAVVRNAKNWVSCGANEGCAESEA